jgi:NitT/TauT family transport system substrate-binding protein
MKMWTLRLAMTLIACHLSLAALLAQVELVFTPQWTAQAQFAGFYVAQTKGFYQEVGLKVQIVHPSSSNPCINRLKDGSSQIITLQLPAAMHQVDQGMQLVNVMQVLQNNSQMIVSHKPLKTIRDLDGKKVGTWHAGFSELAFAVAHQQQINIEWVEFAQNVNLYVSKAVDATMAQSYNEFCQLQLAGQRFQPSQLIYLADIGCNVPEDGIYVTADFYRVHHVEVERFAEATRRGWEWAAEHPEETLDIVMEITRRNGVSTNRPAQRWMLNQILQLAEDRKSGRRTYRLEPEAVALANKLMRQNGYLSKDITYEMLSKP